MSRTADTISAVIPVFNSEESLIELVDRLKTVLEVLTADFEIIMINDASVDNSWDIIRRLTARYPFVRGINLMRNYGQHNAILAGAREARFKTIVTLDDDLQNPPEEIPKLFDELDRGFDVVYGTPVSERHGLLRDLASRLTKLALKVSMGVDIAPHVSAFRVFRTDVRQAFSEYQGPNLSLDVLLAWGTTRFSHVTVNHESRKAGRTNYTIGKLVLHAINMVTGFSALPLRIASLIGFCFTLFGILVLIYVLVRYFLEGNPVQGFPFLASIIAIFSGAQLFAIGIIGEYLARMHFRTMAKPTYIVREIITHKEQASAAKKT